MEQGFPLVAKTRGKGGETVFYCDASHARADARPGLRRRRVFPVRLSYPRTGIYCGHCGRFLG